MHTKPRLSKWERGFFLALAPLVFLLVIKPEWMLVLSAAVMPAFVIAYFLYRFARMVLSRRKATPIVARNIRVRRRVPVAKIKNRWTVATVEPTHSDRYPLEE